MSEQSLGLRSFFLKEVLVCDSLSNQILCYSKLKLNKNVLVQFVLLNALTLNIIWLILPSVSWTCNFMYANVRSATCFRNK